MGRGCGGGWGACGYPSGGQGCWPQHDAGCSGHASAALAGGSSAATCGGWNNAPAYGCSSYGACASNYWGGAHGYGDGIYGSQAGQWSQHTPQQVLGAGACGYGCSQQACSSSMGCVPCSGGVGQAAAGACVGQQPWFAGQAGVLLQQPGLQAPQTAVVQSVSAPQFAAAVVPAPSAVASPVAPVVVGTSATTAPPRTPLRSLGASGAQDFVPGALSHPVTPVGSAVPAATIAAPAKEATHHAVAAPAVPTSPIARPLAALAPATQASAAAAAPPRQKREDDEDATKEEAPTVVLRAVEAFVPKAAGEMALAVGDEVHCFDSLGERGWVFGYVCDTDGEAVKKQGWVPCSFLLPLDVPLDECPGDDGNNTCIVANGVGSGGVGRGRGRGKGGRSTVPPASYSPPPMSANLDTDGQGKGGFGHGNAQQEDDTIPDLSRERGRVVGDEDEARRPRKGAARDSLDPGSIGGVNSVAKGIGRGVLNDGARPSKGPGRSTASVLVAGADLAHPRKGAGRGDHAIPLQRPGGRTWADAVAGEDLARKRESTGAESAALSDARRARGNLGSMQGVREETRAKKGSWKYAEEEDESHARKGSGRRARHAVQPAEEDTHAKETSDPNPKTASGKHREDA